MKNIYFFLGFYVLWELILWSQITPRNLIPFTLSGCVFSTMSLQGRFAISADLCWSDVTDV